MTIGELILILSQFPSTMMVVGRGYEGGYDDPEPREVELIPNGNWIVHPAMPQGGLKSAWYYGRHYDMSTYPDDTISTKAICI